ncbi:MAG: ChrR family anti-sigma-E factor [Chromatiales bacterium]|nr:cupin domain-containing protein [Gammaproteobacteria bacterium]MBW6475546.1 ChrR family anti-sigma-E factor [Chromatiales bacterium]
MTIRHHLDDSTLLAYAAGSLPQGMALLVACHLHNCPHCRQTLLQAEAVGGALLQALEPAPLDPQALQAVMARLDQPDTKRSEAGSVAAAARNSDLPVPLQQHLSGDLASLPWRRMGYGMQHIDLKLAGPGTTRLLKIAPGISVPHHTHGGNELTLILRGSYADEIGRFCAGDVADLDDTVQHQPIVDTDQDCICLIATDAPLRFSGLMGRLAQPFIGM